MRSGNLGIPLVTSSAACNLLNSSTLACSLCFLMTLPPEALRSRIGSLDLERCRKPKEVLRLGLLESEGEGIGDDRGDEEAIAKEE